MRYLFALSLALGLCAACGSHAPASEETAPDRVMLSSGVYRAYPGPSSDVQTALPAGYEPFYVSTYNRHGSRYQPNDKRYVNTLRRLQEAHERGALTPYGEQLLPQIQTLCDSCVGHGGLLTTVGVRQLTGIGNRLYHRYPELFLRPQPDGRPRHIGARASVVTRCGQSMGAFMAGLAFDMIPRFVERYPGQLPNTLCEVDSAYMNYIAYDSPQLREWSKNGAWKEDFQAFYEQHTLLPSVVDRIFADATGLDSLDFVDDLYWLVIGMQNVEVPGCDLSGAMTADELFSCYRCVNYRMYLCNALALQAERMAAESASNLLRNIVESADRAIATDTVAADLRFGHDTSLLRLLALMRIAGATAEVSDPTEAWRVWQEASLCPMGGNLQLVFYRNAAGDILVRHQLNERDVLVDAPDLQPVAGSFYRWSSLREYFLKQLNTQPQSKTDFEEPVQ